MIIKIENVTKKFKNNVILKDVSLTLESGVIYGLIGRNGSGKSVFLKLLCAFYEPTQGEILFDDVNVIKNRSFPKNTRALIEKPNFLPDLSGYENLKILADIQKKIGEREIEDALKIVNLYEEKDKKYAVYSLGMKQKLGLAQVFMEDPQIIILDEPFNGIENKTAEKLRKYLLEERKRGKLIIIATHIKDDIKKLADCVYQFDDGNIKLIKKRPIK